MSLEKKPWCAAGALLSLAALCACGSNAARFEPAGPAVTGGTGAGTMRTDAKRKRYSGLVFVSDYYGNAVWVCQPLNGDVRQGIQQPFEDLQGVTNPVQIAVDKTGTIYVANSQLDANGDGSITEYPRGALSPSKTLTAGLNSTTGVAVDSAGTVYASNKYLGTIEVFPKGRTAPSDTISANLLGPDGLAVDASDNLYIADSSANRVLELSRGSSTPRSLKLEGLLRPTGVAVDEHGNLYVSNLLAQSSNVTVYAPGSTHPSRTIVIAGPKNGSQSTIGETVMLSMAAGDFLLASAFISLAPVDGEWFGDTNAVDGYAYGGSGAAWVAAGIGITPEDAVFQPQK